MVFYLVLPLLELEARSTLSIMLKLAVITSHPIQYYAPWFKYLTQIPHLGVRVFYLWDFGVTDQVDSGFQQTLKWDIPLLEGHDYEFVPNDSPAPGTHHFWGLQNPTLYQQVINYQPDAVLLMSYNYASLYQFLWLWRSKKIPLLFRGDSHRLFVKPSPREWLRRLWISFVYQRFSAFLYVGKANYNYFQHHNVPAEKLFFSPHSIDNDRFEAAKLFATKEAYQWKQELNIPLNHQVVLFVGKFESKKRPIDLLRAFVTAKLKNVSLLFVGSGSLEQELKTLALEQRNVFFAPFQNQTQMPRTYLISDLVVLPSYGLGETWGLAINEAMSLARPVIVSSHVGCAQDLVCPYENGLIFPAGDVKALGNALEEAFSDPVRLQSWGQSSYKTIQSYSYKQATQGLLEALDGIKVMK